MGDIKVTLKIDRLPADVFDFLVSPQSHVMWQAGLQSVEELTAGAPRSGSRFRLRKMIGGRLHTGVWELTSFDPPRAVGTKAETDRGMIDHTSLATMEPVGSGTRFTITVTPLPRGTKNRILFRIMRTLAQRQLANDFARFKTTLEAAAPARS